MSEKRPAAVFTFHTTAAAMAMERLCRERGLPGKLAPTPRSVTADCGICWAAPLEDKDRLANEPGVPEFSGIYEREMAL